MGSLIKINDTLKISKDRGFPNMIIEGDNTKFIKREFNFWNNDERLYHRPPTRVFLVEEIDGKWLYWGHALIVEQTIKEGKTFGIFRIVKIYDSEYQKLVTINESLEGKSYYGI